MSVTPATSSTHLCVLIHGLWGNPGHLAYLASSMRHRFPGPEHTILLPKRNAGNATYDGIEVGAERVTREIEDEMARLEKTGVLVNKISICGYSLGGIVGRYVVGLLWARGIIGKDGKGVKPMSFTTFATPHLGVRTPIKGWHGHAWNVVGARTISKTGRQLFLIDRFRDTGKPLLAVLADPDSIFVHALSEFQSRILYANITNDRSAVYYTTSISKTDPFTDLSEVKINYLPGYSPILVDASNPVMRLRRPSQPVPILKDGSSFLGRWVLGATSLSWSDAQEMWLRARLALFLTIFLPVGGFLFLVNAALQSVLGVQRMRVHVAEGSHEAYSMPILQQRLERARLAAESMYEQLNHEHTNEYASGSDTAGLSSSPDDSGAETGPLLRRYSTKSSISDDAFPTLALTEDQFGMIKSLNRVGWTKYPVHINEARHTHAAIVVRTDREEFREGKIVVEHWLDQLQKAEKEQEEPSVD